ncbi:MAG: CocE/NonD family hydrolase [Gemmatimonadales bacterium]|nr:CocE/NonD family hydrolase [Gemmatimonadales bacterium]
MSDRLHSLRCSTTLALLVTASPLLGQATPASGYDPAAYEQRSADIPMRDGVRLHVEIFRPKGAVGTLPFLFTRTPYGVADSRERLAGSYRTLAEEGYIFVFQDIRGRYRSGGTFVMQRPPKPAGAPAGEIDEITDTHDSIEWLLANVSGHNGRVGMLGVSYAGWTTAMGMLGGHPALRAASPQASPADMFLGDDFHHNGAFRLSYGFEYAWTTEATREDSDFDFGRYDTYEWYLDLGPLSNIQAKVLKDKVLPTWTDFVAHPNYDAFWQRQAMRPYLTRVTVPTLNVAGWWDQEDFYGPMTIYRELEKHDANDRNVLVVGPWRHGSWRTGTGQQLGNINFGSPTGEYFRTRIEAPFFAFYLKGKGTPVKAEATVFEAGGNRWRTFDSWPPRKAETRALYFHPGGRLAFAPPAAPSDSGYDSYVSDPAHPVPYRRRPIEPTYYPNGSGWSTWLLEDQRLADGRPDVLTWETEPLTEDVVLAGEVVAKLLASTTGQDADWVVKLIDVYPENYPADHKLGGYQLMVANEVFRGRFHRSFEKPVPLVPDAVTPFTIGLHTQSYRFKAGHKIMVQVQSTWFPLIDRNPQTWVPNIFRADADDYQAHTHRIWRTPRQASRVEIQTVAP